jgi:hypothetical protein
MDIEEINRRIRKEVCYDTIEELSDIKLIDEYKRCESVKKEIGKLMVILEKNIESKEIRDKIIDEYLLELIPAGTKGVIRGNKFNRIVKEYILSLDLDKDRFEIEFEKNCINYVTTEIPDWYIMDRGNGRVLIGMNQLDLWSGGHQINRGYKYINMDNNSDRRILCVICNFISIKSNKNKVFKLFEEGYRKNSISYIKNIGNIIELYFG